MKLADLDMDLVDGSAPIRDALNCLQALNETPQVPLSREQRFYIGGILAKARFLLETSLRVTADGEGAGEGPFSIEQDLGQLH